MNPHHTDEGNQTETVSRIAANKQRHLAASNLSPFLASHNGKYAQLLIAICEAEKISEKLRRLSRSPQM